jgi:hypothetical protein
MKAKYKPFLKPVIILVGLLVLVGAFIYLKKTKNAPTEVNNEISAPVHVVVPISKKEVSYYRIILNTETPVSELIEHVGIENISSVLSLNRLDDKHLKKGQEIIVPDSFDDLLDLSSFPKAIPELYTVPKMIFISQEKQEFGAYENGILVRFGGVSTGKESTQTSSKLFFTNWKGKLVVSSIDDGWLLPWAFNLDNFAGVSMHQYELPGYPASHSCVRMSEEDAKWVYEWADQWILSPKEKLLASGTPVLVFGKYHYAEKAPWKRLPEDNKAINIPLEDIQKEIAPHTEEIKQKLEQRNTILNPITDEN